MKQGLIIFVLFVAMLGGVYWYAESPKKLAPENTVYYTNPTYGISFSYPDTYELVEQDIGSGERRRYVIALADKEALSRAPQNGEGPPSITFDIFQNNIDNTSIENWIRGTNFSNFKLNLDGELSPTSVGRARALSYTWDGLYRSQSIVFEHNENIVMSTVGYLSAQDEIVRDFTYILSTVELF